MGVQPNRNLSDRELRSLDLNEFLALIQEDIKELDHLRRQRRRTDTAEKPAPTRKGRRRAEATEPELDVDEPVVSLTLHTVSCCGKKMGSFPALARVRCPFCERWHTAGDFPVDEE